MVRKFKIVFIGPDGSGKTTLINFFRAKLESEGNSAESFFMGWRDFSNPVLKISSKIYLKNKSEEKDKERIDRYKPRSWFFYFIYYSELWLRYLKVLASNKNYILFDRYFYDELLFSSKSKFNFFSKITPKPDLCFILRPSIKLLMDRNQKVSERKLAHFYKRLNKVSKLCNSCFIDGSQSPSEIYLKFKNLKYGQLH